MKSAKSLTAIFVFFIGVTFYCNGQNKRLYKGQYHGGGKSQRNISFRGIAKNELITLFATTGVASYSGDLSGGVGTRSYRPQIGAGILLRTNYLGKRLYLRADVRLFRLYSNDAHEDRNLNFRSTNWEFLAIGQYEFFPYEKLMRRRTFINPYVYAGIGLMTFDPWGQLPNGKWKQLRPLQTEKTAYGNVAFAYTLGAGLKFRYSYKWNFMVEGGYRFTTTDYIDDVSKSEYQYTDAPYDSWGGRMSNKTGHPEAGTAGRGNPKSRDGYFMFSAGVTYTFTKSHKAKVKQNQHLLRK